MEPGQNHTRNSSAGAACAESVANQPVEWRARKIVVLVSGCEPTAMKALLAIVLSGLMAWPAYGQTNTPPPPPQPGSAACPMLLYGLVLFTVATGAAVVIYIYRKHKSPGVGDTATFVLKKSLDHVTWTPVSTNTITITTNEPPIELFRADMDRDKTAFYKLDCIGK